MSFKMLIHACRLAGIPNVLEASVIDSVSSSMMGPASDVTSNSKVRRSESHTNSNVVSKAASFVAASDQREVLDLQSQ